MTKNRIYIELSKEESLVLFELLNRILDEDMLIQYADKSEEKVLQNIENILERNLSEPFLENYLELLQEARNKIIVGDY